MKIPGIRSHSHDASDESPINYARLLQRPSLWVTLFFATVAIALGA